MKSSYTNKEQYYGDYLELDKILNAQHLESKARGIKAHDEMLFIIMHQTSELWFKQIMHELQSILDIFEQEFISDNDPLLQTAVHRTNRIVEIWRLLVKQVDVLETMTSRDFLDFRDLLAPASGFQSVQFRLLETKLGLKMTARHAQRHYESQLRTEDIQHVRKTEEKVSFIDYLNEWLERAPFLDEQYWEGFEVIEGSPTDMHPFLANYRTVYEGTLLQEERKTIALSDFDRIFVEEDSGVTKFSHKAMQAILFITIYRDYPLLQGPFLLLRKWLEIDELMANWRYRHMSMVRRMIGMRVGTGGSSGANYLKGAMNKHHIFGDIALVTTYLMPHRKVPKLPEQLVQKFIYPEW